MAEISRADAGYPRRLLEVNDAPEQLQIRGRIPDAALAVAIVGARAAYAEEQRAAHDLAYTLARRGVLIVSGGALGIDAAAHRGALAAARDSGSDTPVTVAVLGCGVDVVYPEEHAELYREIAAHGAVVSQFPRDAAPRGWHFARRNRTLAGLADAVVVIAAGAHSGALRTAKAARDYNRLLAAMPGRPGCEALISSGAAVVRTVDDLDRALAGNPRRPTVALPDIRSPHYQVLTQLQPGDSKDIDELVTGTGLAVRVIQRALTNLELDGLVVPRPGLGYECSPLARQLLATRGTRG